MAAGLSSCPRARLALIRPPRGGNPKGGSARAPSDQQSAEVGHPRKRRSERGISASTTTTLPRAPGRGGGTRVMKWTRCVATGGEVRALNDAYVPRRALGAARDRDRDGRAASIPPRCRPCRCRLVFSSRPVASRSRRLIPPTPHPHPPPPSPQPPPSPRSGHSATLVGTSHLVVFGGLNVKTAIGDTVALHLERNQWRRPPSSAVGGPGPRAFHCAVAIGSRLYVMCGRTWRQQHGDVWCLDCVSWCWRRLRPTGAAPSPRDFGVAAATPSGGILLFGGYDGHKWLNDCHVLENIGEGG